MIKVITYGTFDLFHEGHYRLLKRAKELGDYLIVGVTTESYDQTRGKLNVVDSLVTRIENIKKTGFADEIILEESQGQKFRDIKKYQIDIFTVGSDWTGQCCPPSTRRSTRPGRRTARRPAWTTRARPTSKKRAPECCWRSWGRRRRQSSASAPAPTATR